MRKSRLLLMLVGFFLCGQVSAAVVYMNDFNTGSGSIGLEWSGANWHGSHGIVSPHIGDYSLSNGATLTLTGLSAHSQVALEFDLYLFNTWDGSNPTYGPDYFSISGDVLFSSTFTNHQTKSDGSPDQTYPGVADVNGGLPGPGVTQIYYGLDPSGTGSQFVVSHTGSTFSVKFAGPTTQTDEQWGIDNVKVSIITSDVPEPATIALLGLGLALLGFSSRRNKFILLIHAPSLWRDSHSATLRESHHGSAHA